ncbi:MAG: PilZ domain-containing protein [Terriglobales bacterium]
MKLNSLLISQDPAALSCLVTALAKLEIETEVCPSCDRAIERLVNHRYSAVVLDFDEPGAAQVAQMVRLAGSERPPLMMALVTQLGPVSGAFQAGIKFVLYKPLRPQDVAQSLWDAKQFMRRDRRRSRRDNVKGLVQLQVAGLTLPAFLRDLSEQGLAVQAAEPLTQVRSLPLRFVLPGTVQTVHAIGEVIWADDTGRAGLFFSRLTPSSQKHLRNWLARRAGRKDAVRVLLPPKQAPRLRSLAPV